MTAAEEQAIISKVRHGDRDAFEALVLDNQAKVYSLARRMTGNDSDALDVAQEAFLKAYTSLDGFRGDSRFSVWLYRLVYNLCVDFSRKKKRADITPLTVLNEEGEAEELELPDLRYGPESALERKELRETLSKSIDALPPKHRDIILMREITGMCYEDIATALGVSEGTVKSRLSRARLSLAQLLSQYGTFYNSTRHKGREEVTARD